LTSHSRVKLITAWHFQAHLSKLQENSLISRSKQIDETLSIPDNEGENQQAIECLARQQRHISSASTLCGNMNAFAFYSSSQQSIIHRLNAFHKNVAEFSPEAISKHNY
jgi:hypothetical protein